ncbi:MAG: LytR C-terminal domain-containing protein [Actinobacteria bacterium]|nr:LytR C-terminal domain-containing protein [Actinomycetota bacterium]MCA1721907.1 LytR C-terminal domain-containing protein [Actinomycetota bacterium]
MRIPSGDLAPVRKRRRYGKRRNPLPVLLGALLVAAIAVGAYVLQREDDAAGQVSSAARCPSAAPVPSPQAARGKPVVLPAPRTVKLLLLNGTGRDGLARTVGNELARRGFTVGGMGNAPRPLAGATLVTYGASSGPAAQLVGAQIIGAKVQARKGPGGVEVTLGSSFVRLRTPAEVSAYVRSLGKPVAAPKPAPTKACA